MEKLQKLTPGTIKDLIPEKILGLPELIKVEYTPTETNMIKAALFDFANSKNENYREEVVYSWINTFSELRVSAFEIIKRIRLAKLEKKFGNTEFAIFMNVDITEYSTLFKHKALNSNYVDPEIERLNNEIKKIAS